MMMIYLDLSAHCIETELKRRYNQSLSAYFKADAKDMEVLEQAIELLQQALVNLNFPQLRARFPELSGGSNQKISLARKEDTLVIAAQDTIYEKKLPADSQGRCIT